MNLLLKRILFIGFLGAVVVMGGVLWVLGADQRDDRLMINEIAFSTASGIDWIEIYNPSIRSVSLTNFYLSDDPGQLDRFQIQESIGIGPGEFVVIYCADYEGDLTGTTITDFRIREGETVFLVDTDGSTVVDSMVAVLNNDAVDSSLGRYPDGGDEFYVMPDQTPGEPNATGIQLDPTNMSVPDYEELFGLDEIKRFDFYISDESIAEMEAYEGEMRDTEDPPYVYADLEYNDVLYEDVAVRNKGNSSLHSNRTTKLSLRVDMNKYVDGQSLLGLQEFVLNCNFKDPSQMREAIAYEIYAAAGVPASQVAFAEVYINDEYVGLYTMVENVDDQYLDRVFGNSDGDLFKAGNQATFEYLGEDETLYYEPYEHKRENELMGYTALMGFIELVNSEVTDDWDEQMLEVFDVYEFLDYFAMNFVQSNMDSYPVSGHNFYFYYDTAEGLYKVMPWDVNEAFGNFGNYEENVSWNVYDPTDEMRALKEADRAIHEKLEFEFGMEVGSFKSGQDMRQGTRPLFTQIYSVEEFQQYYLDQVENYLDLYWNLDYMEPIIDDRFELIVDSVKVEPESSKQYTFEQFVQNIEEDVENVGALEGNRMPLGKKLNTNLFDLPPDEKPPLEDLPEGMKPPQGQMQNGEGMPMQGQFIHGLKSFIQKRNNALTNQLAKTPPQ